MLRLHPSAYGITIQQEIAERTHRAPSLGSVYAALDRLEQNGYAVSRQGEPTAERGGRRKLYFTVTASGQASLKSALQALESLRHGVRWKEARV
jgi:PadR family transcriptional regulator, regulatory protein PadR